MIHVTNDIIGSVRNPLTNELAHIIRFTMVNDESGMTVQVMTYGASVFSIKVKNVFGQLREVTLGYDSVEEYASPNNPYFGATIGRVCNRINNGKFKIGDNEYQLTQNAYPHHFHGGDIGFNRIPWGVKELYLDGVEFCHVSKDNEEGYPGELFATCRYTLTPDNVLHVYMTALTGKPTIVNMTNHMYFNLAGHNSGRDGLNDHFIAIYGNDILNLNRDKIPTGTYCPVSFTNLDFRTEKNLGESLQSLPSSYDGFDHNFCIHRLNLSDKDSIPSATAAFQKAGLWMEVRTNQPGIQFTTATNLPDPLQEPIIGRDNAAYYKNCAFCFQTQKFPDAPNHPLFPSIVLQPGQLYEHRISYKFGTTRPNGPTPVVAGSPGSSTYYYS